MRLQHIFSGSVAVLALGTLLTVAPAAPRGHLAYIQGGYAVVRRADTGRVTRLPRSQGTQQLAISPRGAVVYFAVPKGAEVEEGPQSQDGYLAAAPYKTARKLPALLQGESFGLLRWNPSGTALWLRGFEINGVYTPGNQRFAALGETPDSVSRDGKIVALLAGEEIRVRNLASGKERVVFNYKTPQVLIAALKRAKNPAKLRDLTTALDARLAKDAINWALSTPALSPDASRLYFCSNVGSGQGAAGNSDWAIFAADLKTGAIEVLSQVGAQVGRMPDVLEVSPDGKRLLALITVHSSAVENSSYALVIDLLTQKSRVLTRNLAPKNTDTNIMDSAVWSPDGRYVALSAYFYKAENIWKNAENWRGPADKDWTLFIHDAATGKVVRRTAGAHGPSWAK